MTEEEAKKALFELHFWYMSHDKSERLKLYDEYQEKRRDIKKKLIEFKESSKKNNLI